MTDTTQSPTTTETFDKLKHQAADTAEQVQSATREQFDKLESTIRRNPVAAAGVAAGVGFLLALLARR